MFIGDHNGEVTERTVLHVLDACRLQPVLLSALQHVGDDIGGQESAQCGGRVGRLAVGGQAIDHHLPITYDNLGRPLHTRSTAAMSRLTWHKVLW